MLTIVMTTFFSTATAQEKDPQVEAVETATAKLIEAFLKPNAEILSSLASKQLSYGHSSGKVESKEQFVNTLISGASVFEEINITNQTVYIEGNTAIVRHVLSAKTNDPGKGPANIRIGILLTWIKNNGNWELLARQAFPLPQ